MSNTRLVLDLDRAGRREELLDEVVLLVVQRGAADWEPLDLDRAVDMIADRFIASRRSGWQDHDEKGRPLRRTMAIASLGGATLDNEENYLIKKLFTAAGAIQIENQARI